MSSNVHMQALVRFVVEARTALRVDACLAWIRAAVAAAETHAAQAWRRDDVQAALAVLLDADLLSLVSTVSLALALVALYFALREAAPVLHPLDAHAPSDMATWDDRDGSGKRDIYASLKTYANSKASQRPSAATTSAGNPGSLNREFVQMPQLNMQQQQQQQQQQRYDPYSSGPYAAAAGAPSSSSYLSSARGAGNGNGNGSSSSAAPYTPISASPALSGYESDFTGRCVCALLASSFTSTCFSNVSLTFSPDPDDWQRLHRVAVRRFLRLHGQKNHDGRRPAQRCVCASFGGLSVLYSHAFCFFGPSSP